MLPINNVEWTDFAHIERYGVGGRIESNVLTRCKKDRCWQERIPFLMAFQQVFS